MIINLFHKKMISLIILLNLRLFVSRSEKMEICGCYIIKIYNLQITILTRILSYIQLTSKIFLKI